MSKRLEEIKNEVAKEQGYESFYNLITDYSFCGSSMENVINEISTLYATECVKASLVKVKNKIPYYTTDEETLFESIILNPENISLL